MLNLSRPGIDPASPALAGRIFTTGSPGKPWINFLSKEGKTTFKEARQGTWQGLPQSPLLHFSRTPGVGKRGPGSSLLWSGCSRVLILSPPRLPCRCECVRPPLFWVGENSLYLLSWGQGKTCLKHPPTPSPAPSCKMLRLLAEEGGTLLLPSWITRIITVVGTAAPLLSATQPCVDRLG